MSLVEQRAIEEPYTEMDEKAPESVYGTTKLEGENAIVWIVVSNTTYSVPHGYTEMEITL